MEPMKQELSDTPAIAIFAFKRADVLSKTLEALSNARGVNGCDIYVHVDHPRNESEMKEKLLVLDTIERFRLELNYKKVEIEQNHLGLRNSVISFLSVLASSHRYLVVLEDDILVAEDFLEYQIECLRRFEFHEGIGSVSGGRFEKFRNLSGGDLLLSRRHSSWGWGTWGQVLQSINWEILDDSKGIAELRQSVAKVGGDLCNLIDLSLGKKIDSWSIIFDINMIVNKKYCIHPRYQKIQNIGFQSGTHFKNSVLISRKSATEIEVKSNQIRDDIPRGLRYDFIIKIKRNSSFIGLLAKFKNLLLSNKPK
jgi:hypothetical protein